MTRLLDDPRRVRAWAVAFAIAAASLGADPRNDARAGEAGTARAQARVFAEEGQRQLLAGHPDAALEQLQKADALFHAPTIDVLMARALVALDRKEDAYLAYTRAVDAALPPDARGEWTDAQGVAAKERSELGKTLGLVKLVAVGDAPTQLAIDGRPASAGSRAPVRPGDHVVTWDAGTEHRSTSVTLAAGQELEVEISGTPKPAPPRPPAPRPAAPKPADTGGSPALLGGAIVGLVLGGGGVAAGIGLGVTAMNDRASIDDQCVGTRCLASAADAIDQGTAFAHGSTAAFVIGGAALATGAVLLGIYVASDSGDAEVAVMSDGAGATARWSLAW